jgi:hypothetical protein
MSVRLLTCAVVGLVLAGPAAAQPARPKPKSGDQLLAALRQPVSFDRLNETPLAEVLRVLNQEFHVMFVLRDDAFRAAGHANIREERAESFTTPIDGVALHRFLALVLDGMNATYLVRRDFVEIVPIDTAAKETKNARPEAGPEGLPAILRLKEPLVAVAYKEKPLNEALADLAEEYDLTVVVSPQSGDARIGFVTARLLNVPADRAVELLALQSDLRVVRRGTAYLVTSKDHVEGLASEQLEREKLKFEREQLRKGVAPPAPPPAPAPEPEPKKP